MKFKINTLALKRILKDLHTVAGIKSVKPILSTTKISVYENCVTFEAFNMEQYILKKEAEVEIESTGSACVHIKTLLDYITEVAHEEVTFKYLEEKDSIRISASRSRFHIKVLPSESFPVLQAHDPVFVDVPSVDFIGNLEKVAPSINKDHARAVLSAVYISSGEFFATDGHTLRSVCSPVMDIVPEDILIPHAALDMLKKLFSKTEVIRFGIDTGWLYMQEGDILFACTLLASQYPNVRGLIPAASTAFLVKFNREDMLHSVKRLGAVVKADNHQNVVIQFNQGTVELTVKSLINGEAAETVDCEGFDSDYCMGLNSLYLKKALESLEEDVVELSIVSALKPVVFREGEYTHVIMPTRVT